MSSLLHAAGLLLALGLAPGDRATAEERPPQAFLQLASGELRLRAGEPVDLVLALPDGESWETAYLGELQVRTWGRSWRLRPEGGPPVLLCDEPGVVMIVLAAGPASQRGRRDAALRTPWCSKLILRVDEAEARAATAGSPASPDATAKVGMTIELRPYFDPTELRPGPDTVLPVKAYFDNSSLADASVTTHGPEGLRQAVVTDAQGYALLAIDRPGRWLVRLVHPTEEGPYLAELAFEIAAADSSAKP